MTAPIVSRGAKPRICFVAPRAYNVLTQDRLNTHIGGAEVQQAVLAHGLVDRGYAVSFVTLDHGQVDGEVVDGIRIFCAYRESAGVPGMRFFYPRMTRMWSALSRAAADVYFQRTSDSLTGIVAAWTGWKHRRFIFSVGAMADTDPALPNCPTRRERWLYLYGLRRADIVLGQTSLQLAALERNFGIHARLLRSAAADPSADADMESATGARPRFLWVGRFCWEKRPDWLPDLALRYPQADFDVAGGSGPLQAIGERCRGIANIRMHGYIPHHRMDDFYRGATALICTSVIEGFPNTFLEAWSRGIPVVTTVDPGDAVQSEGLGLVVRDRDELAQGLVRLAGDPELRRHMSIRCRRYFSQAHSTSAVLDRFEEILAALSTSTDR